MRLQDVERLRDKFSQLLDDVADRLREVVCNDPILDRAVRILRRCSAAVAAALRLFQIKKPRHIQPRIDGIAVDAVGQDFKVAVRPG